MLGLDVEARDVWSVKESKDKEALLAQLRSFQSAGRRVVGLAERPKEYGNRLDAVLTHPFSRGCPVDVPLQELISIFKK